ncbi:hypothetical protein GIB67_003007 [Kingdonia uniflora]|uniref:PGG domain-containing protein n=1 Tax=Kingdonia uniflora TaxID=39325 RepID=A0A7J7LYF2_9MAGN|nr:hypothetical protein GIB67_003007 [Kingdonia uniflora]
MANISTPPTEMVVDPSNSSQTNQNTNNPVTETSSPSNSPQTNQNTNPRDLSFYMPLQKAAFKGDWDAANKFFERYQNVPYNIAITSSEKTALHIAAASGQTTFVKDLIGKMELKRRLDMLETKERGGHTALYFAVAAGNLEAAKAMVEKNAKLPQIPNTFGDSPILEAARLGHKELLQYLYEKTVQQDSPSNDASPLRGSAGVKLLNAIIAADFYDIALKLVEDYPQVATAREQNGTSALAVLARRSSSFESGTELGFWGLRIYSCWLLYQYCSSLFTCAKHSTPSTPGAEHLTNQAVLSTTNTETQSLIPASGEDEGNPHLVVQIGNHSNPSPPVEHLNNQAVPSTTNAVTQSLNPTSGQDVTNPLSCVDCIRSTPMLGTFTSKITQEHGTVEFMVTSLHYFPQLISMQTDSHTILHKCITHRQEKVFKLLHNEWSAYRTSLAAYQDSKANNILHLAAKLAPPDKLMAVSGAALQMQREMQWYKFENSHSEFDNLCTPTSQQRILIDSVISENVVQAVEDITKPTLREKINKKERTSTTLDGDTPRALFVKEHEKLVKDGEKWMRGLASSCSFVATLIATMVGAAAQLIKASWLDVHGSIKTR